MQGYPFDLALTMYPPLELQIMDTARPKQTVPVYFIHSLQQPYCPNPTCKCHSLQQEIKHLLRNIVDGLYTLREAADLIDDKKEGEA